MKKTGARSMAERLRSLKKMKNGGGKLSIRNAFLLGTDPIEIHAARAREFCGNLSVGRAS